MSTTRPRPSSTLPKPPTTLHPTAVIADSASLTGKHRITIGANSILHPRARITSTHGPVTIGKGCIISEKVVLGWQQDGTVTAGSEVVRGSGDFVVGAAGEDGGERGFGGVVLGDDVVLEPACSVQGSVGRGSCVEVGARVGRGARVGEYCKIAPLCTVADGEVLADYEVLFGNGQRRMERPGLEGFRKTGHDKEIHVLKRLIPSSLAKWQSVGDK